MLDPTHQKKLNITYKAAFTQLYEISNWSNKIKRVGNNGMSCAATAETCPATQPPRPISSAVLVPPLLHSPGGGPWGWRPARLVMRQGIRKQGTPTGGEELREKTTKTAN